MKAINYIPLALFSAQAIKAIAVGVSLNDAIALLVLGSVAAYFEFKTEQKKVEEQDNRLKALEQKLEDQAKSFDHLNTHVAGLKLGQQLRSTNVRQ